MANAKLKKDNNFKSIRRANILARWAVALTASSSILLAMPQVHAGDLPSGGSVVSGSAVLSSPDVNSLLISQTSTNAILEFDTFSIGNGHDVHFENGSGSTLSRVLGDYQTRIDGNLTATGNLFLINKNGVIVGREGAIETGGSFLASTRDITNDDFLNGRDNTFSGDSHGEIVNMGRISSMNGDVSLLAHRVVNQGSIDARNGSVGLAAGVEFLLRDNDHADGRILVKAGQSGNGVDHRGTIVAAEAELRAHGGNVYALAQNNGGSIQVTGSAKRGGRLFLTASGGTVRTDQRISVKKTVRRNIQTGGEIFINADIASIGGNLDASGLIGGSIDIGANEQIDLSSALLTANGEQAGGNIRIGGEFQGGRTLPEDEVQNTDFLLVDAASAIEANASTGPAGTVVLWSDVSTSFSGRVSTRGADAKSGGFIEISSAGKVTIDGSIDSGGGHLLIDPENINIGGPTTGSRITVPTLVGALATGDVTVWTDPTVNPAAPNSGNISVDRNVFYNSPNNLTLLAMGDIRLESSIQNSNDTSGDVNLVAGWDGIQGLPTTPLSSAAFDFAPFDAAPIAAPGIFGNSEGDIILGDNSVARVAVGSRSGSTRLYGRNLFMNAASEGSGGYTQVGFKVSDEGTGYPVTGMISVRMSNDINVTGGNTNRSYAQIGHVGLDIPGGSTPEAAVNADIRIEANNDLNVNAGGGNFSYAQVGHGGYQADGDFAGAINVVTANNINQSGGSGFGAHSQIGHGGGSADGTHSGDITVQNAVTMSLAGGSGVQSFAQFGHGGEGADGDSSGAITIQNVGDVSITGGGRREAYAHLGHGGDGADGNHSGAVSITSTGDVNLTGGSALEAYAQLGHGGDGVSGNLSGDLTVNAVDLDILGGSARGTYAQLGHGSADMGDPAQATGTRQGAITTTLTGEASIQNGPAANNRWNFGWIGHATMTDGGVSNADFFLQADAIDRNTGTTVASGANGFLRTDILQNAVSGGNTDIRLLDSGVRFGPAIGFSTANNMQVSASNNVVLRPGSGLENTGSGNIVLAAGNRFHNDTGSLTPVSTAGGRWAVYSRRPDNNRNDIEITNYDYLQYGVTFDPSNPLPGFLPSGDGLVYRVTPTFSADVADETIVYGDPINTPATNITPLLVNGLPVVEAEFGVSVATATAAPSPFLPTSGSGNVVVGFYPGGLVASVNQSTNGKVVRGINSGQSNGNLTVTPRPLNLNATAQDKVYDGNTLATAAIVTDAIAGDDVVTGFATANFSDKNVGTNKTVTITGPTISGADLGNYTYGALPISALADITPRPLKIEANAKDKVYDGNTIAQFTLSDDRIAGDLLTIGASAANFEDKNVGDEKLVTLSGVSVSGPDAGNYAFSTSVTDRADITPRPLNVAINALDKEYDGNTAATISLTDDRIAGDDLQVMTGIANFETKDVGMDKSVTFGNVSLGGGDAGNYTLISPTEVFADITPRLLTVTADAGQYKLLGELDPNFTYLLTGGSLVDGDTLDGALSREPGEDPGFYPLLVGSLSAGGNYTINFISNPFEIINPVTLIGNYEPQQFEDPIGDNSALIEDGNCAINTAQYGPAGTDGVTDKESPIVLDTDCPIVTSSSQ